MVKTMGGSFKKLLLVGCEPATLGGEDGVMGLSQEVQAAVPEAVVLVESLVNQQVEKYLKKTNCLNNQREKHNGPEQRSL
jgi:hydrogenase maturation protease